MHGTFEHILVLRQQDSRLILATKEIKLPEHKCDLQKIKSRLLLSEMNPGDKIKIKYSDSMQWVASCNRQKVIFAIFSKETINLEEDMFLGTIEEIITEAIPNYYNPDVTSTEINEKLGCFINELVELYNSPTTIQDIPIELKRLKKKYFIRNLRALQLTMNKEFDISELDQEGSLSSISSNVLKYDRSRKYRILIMVVLSLLFIVAMVVITYPLT